jgi:hypothetical protein
MYHFQVQKMTRRFGDIFSEINLDSSIIYVIILTNLIFLASKLGVPTLNIIWSFLHDRDIKDMSLDFDHVIAVSSLMDRLLELSKNSLQYGNSMCPSVIRKLKVIVYFCKVFLLSKLWGKHPQFLDMHFRTGLNWFRK